MSRRKARREEHILTDAGPLAALVDRNDPNFGRVLEEMKRLPDAPLLTTWPCSTEAMYLVGEADGHRAQEALWGDVEDDLVRLHDLSAEERRRMRALILKYRDTPMDFADASLVAVAETLDLRRILTVDSDFYVYRLADGDAFEVVVGPNRR
jgi:predicted nucleic acid-binding protein